MGKSDIARGRTAASAATDYLRRSIISGELAPGSPINQNEVASELGVSRSPVRDAIAALAAERLVIAKAHATAVVAPLGLDDLQELYELRMAIEPALCRLALPNLSRATVLHMEEQLETMEQTDNALTWVTTNDRFHADMYRQAARPRMVDIVDHARQQTGRYTRVLISELGMGQSNEQHRAILDAVVAADAPRLEAEVLNHLSSACDVILKLLYDKGRNEAVLQGTSK
ncbi:MAG: GntR family transcriptional regulator [Acidimicrobiia bacterium]|nr:GntR family transcriptional regulator [Acidimicrobiia bacterium]